VFRNRPVSLALVGLFLWVTGCSTYTQIELAEVADHGKVRVTMTDRERDLLYDPEIVTDSIRGYEKPEGKRRYNDRIVVLPLDEMSTLESVYADGNKTAGVIGYVILGTAVVLVAVALIACCPGLNPLGGPDSVEW